MIIVIKKIFSPLFFSFLTIIGLIVLYFSAAFILAIIPVNTSVLQSGNGFVTIYLITNGAHTDFVLPVKNEYKDWSYLIAYTQSRSEISDQTYIAFGWGDKQFYMETPTWSDLRVTTAFRALFFLGTGALHVTVHEGIQTGEGSVSVHISSKQYQQIVSYIEKTFQHDSTGNVILIPNISYSPFDCFFEAHGTFSLFYTCNSWVNVGLTQSGLRAPVWTPFDKGIFYHYQKGTK